MFHTRAYFRLSVRPDLFMNDRRFKRFIISYKQLYLIERMKHAQYDSPFKE